MLNMDIYSLEVLIPSVVGVVAIATVMVLGFIKACRLINEEQPH